MKTETSTDLSFIIISYPKVGDRNKDTDSKTRKYGFVWVSKYAHKNIHIPTHILTKYLSQIYITLPENQNTELPKHSN